MQRRTATLSFISLTVGLALASCATAGSDASADPAATPAPAAAPAPAPAASGRHQCGHVTADEGVVPESQGVYQAFITQIDGKSTTTATRHRVDAGTHTLTISEQIPPEHLSATEIVNITKMKRREDAKAYKKFEVTVEPGMTHRIGVRINRDKLDNASIEANAYWEPVVWETVPAKCP